MQGIVSNFNDLNGPGEGPYPCIQSLVVHFARLQPTAKTTASLVEGNAVVPLTNSPCALTIVGTGYLLVELTNSFIRYVLLD